MGAAAGVGANYSAWLTKVAPAGTSPAGVSAAAAQLERLDKTGAWQPAKLEAALAPLGLSPAALKKVIGAFRDAFEVQVRPEATAKFFDPQNQAKQRAWHDHIKANVVDPISGQRSAPAAGGAGGVPAAGPLPLPATVVSELLANGSAYHDGNALAVNDGAKTLSELLVSESKKALAAKSFSERNLVTAQVTAAVSAVQAAASAGVTDPAKVDQLYQLFFTAAYQAGDAFRAAFNPDGTKSAAPGADDARKAAQNAAGGVAYAALPRLVEILGAGKPGESAAAFAKQVVQRAAIEDTAAVASSDLHLNYYPSASKIAETLKQVVSPDDYFFSEIDRLPGHDAERNVLSLGVRLANTTWMAGQAHRAAWEGTTRRIDPQADGRLSVYNPYDNLKADMYNATFEDELARATDEGLTRQAALGRAGERAFARVVFEMYKDLVELKKAAGGDT
ncbi:MAG: hypothetical protein K1X89_06700 [Myxococcaceae bacterium]|nr:hypothetical protein [Myxococcaceae bacterium]